MFRDLSKKFIHYHGFSILCAIGIFILCTIQIPPDDNLPAFPNFDKVVHFTMYFTLSIAVILESFKIRMTSWKDIFKAFAVAIIVSAVFGAAIEFIQQDLTSYRSGDIMDWVFDMGGSVAACLVIGLIRLAFR